jgi:hypothetical protein
MQRLFELSSFLVLPFWLLMILAPRWRWTRRIVSSPFIVLGPVGLYAFLLLPHLLAILPALMQPRLEPIAALLGQPLGTTIAWAHFLALDLFAARWIYLDAGERGLSAWALSPLLALTLMFGPLGLGAYLAVRSARRPGLRKVVDQVYAGSPALAWITVGSLLLLAVSLALQTVDHRLITGASAWLKPAKFGASVAVTAPMLAWILAQLPRRRGLRIAAGVLAATFAIELAVIVVQVVRGVPSHFNVSTPINGALWSVMGSAVICLWLAEGYIAWRAFQHRFASDARTWGIRLGLVTALVGGALGGLMPRPTSAQLGAMRAGEPATLIGAHTVGAPDGGPGLPMTRWSTEGGDLRVPHFFGLHALQVLPLLGLLLERRRRRGQTRLVVAASAGWIGLMGVTLVQALRGQPLLAPDSLTLVSAAAVLLVAAALTVGTPAREPTPALTA